jgi:hypothetical protein
MKNNKLLVLILALMQGSAFGNWGYHKTSSPTASPTSSPTTNYTTAKIEFDPDIGSVSGNCTADFTALLTTQVSIWFVDAVASVAGKYPSVNNASGVATLTNFHGSKWGHRLLNQENGDMTEEQSVGGELLTADQNERKLCSKTDPTCGICCPSWCSAWCVNGGCGVTCPNQRQLRAESSRKLNGGRHWQYGDGSYPNTVAGMIQFAARRWLSQNDPTQCMGDPWKLVVQVFYS